MESNVFEVRFSLNQVSLNLYNIDVNPEDDIPAGASVSVLIDNEIMSKNNITNEDILTLLLYEILAADDESDDSGVLYSAEVEKATATSSDTVIIV